MHGPGTVHAASEGRRAVFPAGIAFQGVKVIELVETPPILAAS
jgi:hypothetical protein